MTIVQMMFRFVMIVMTLQLLNHSFTFTLAQDNMTTITPMTTSPNADQTEFMTTSLLVNVLVVNAIVDAMGGNYNLSLNVYKWNFTEIVSILNSTNPTWLYDGLDTALLEAFLPSYVLSNFPVDVLVYRCLCDYIPSTYTNISCSETSCNDELTPVCEIYPLVYSKYPNPIQESDSDADLSECGLQCTAGKLVYGLSSDEQSLVDAFKVIGTTICFIAILFLFVNQILDQKFSKEKFWSKPLLHHCPYFISAAVFSIMILMTLGEVIGKKNIVCNLNDTEESFSFYNPFDGKNVFCAIQGTLFYSSLLYYMFYTVLLSFVIFRQFYRPMRPLWNIPKQYWHLLIFLIVLFYDIIGFSMSSIDGIWPMGVCLPGPAKKEELLWFLCIPLAFCCSLVGAFLIGSILLLNFTVKDQEKLTNKASTQQIRDLLSRMSIYCIGVMLTLMLLTATSFRFYDLHDRLRTSMQSQIECWIEIEYGLRPDTDECLRETSISPFWFISWIISCLTAVLAQLILSCHVQSRERAKGAVKGVGTKLEKMKSSVEKSVRSSQKSNEDNPEHSNLHGAEGYRTAGGTIVGIHRKVTAFEPVESTSPPMTPSPNRNGNHQSDLEMNQVSVQTTTNTSTMVQQHFSTDMMPSNETTLNAVVSASEENSDIDVSGYLTN